MIEKLFFQNSLRSPNRSRPGYIRCCHGTESSPDITPGIGYVDDLGVLTSAVAAVSMYIDQDVRTQAAEKIRDWFGDL